MRTIDASMMMLVMFGLGGVPLLTRLFGICRSSRRLLRLGPCGYGSRRWCRAGGLNLTHNHPFKPEGLRYGICRARGARGGIDSDRVIGGSLEGKNRDRTDLVKGLRANMHRQISLQVAQPVSRLVAMFLHIPGEDAHLVKIVGQPVFIRAQHRYVFEYLAIRE